MKATVINLKVEMRAIASFCMQNLFLSFPSEHFTHTCGFQVTCIDKRATCSGTQDVIHLQVRMPSRLSGALDLFRVALDS